MAIHSTILTWKIPWAEEPGGPVRGAAKECEQAHTHHPLASVLYFETPETFWGAGNVQFPLFPSQLGATETLREEVMYHGQAVSPRIWSS